MTSQVSTFPPMGKFTWPVCVCVYTFGGDELIKYSVYIRVVLHLSTHSIVLIYSINCPNLFEVVLCSVVYIQLSSLVMASWLQNHCLHNSRDNSYITFLVNCASCGCVVSLAILIPAANLMLFFKNRLLIETLCKAFCVF